MIKHQDLKCRRCGIYVESQAHILNHCKANALGPTRKHNAVLEFLGDYLRGISMDVDIDIVPIEIDTKIRPDLIGRNHKLCKVHIIDLKVPYDSIENFDLHRDTNRFK